jgi:tetratricopeptide (TPR) repeat protein
MIKAAIGKQNVIYARMLANLGTVYLENGYFASATTTLREALQIAERLPHPDSVETAEMQSRMGEVLARQGHYAEADRMLGLALPVLKRAGATAEEATTLGSLGMLRGLERRYAEAVDATSTQVVTLETTFGPEHPRLLRPLNNLAVVYAQAGRMQEAGAAFRRAVAICEKQLPPGHPNHAALLTNYAAFLRQTGERAQAKAVEAEARSLARDNARRDGLGMTVDVSAFLSKK